MSGSLMNKMHLNGYDIVGSTAARGACAPRMIDWLLWLP